MPQVSASRARLSRRPPMIKLLDIPSRTVDIFSAQLHSLPPVSLFPILGDLEVCVFSHIESLERTPRTLLST